MLARERIAYALLAISLLLTLFGISTSPNEVPIHWDFEAKPDAYGSPWMWSLVWILLTAVTVMLSLLTRKLDVSKWNRPYPMKGPLLEAWYLFSMSIMFDTILILVILELIFALIFATKLYTIMSGVVYIILAVVAAYMIYAYLKWRRIKQNIC